MRWAMRCVFAEWLPYRLQRDRALYIDLGSAEPRLTLSGLTHRK